MCGILNAHRQAIFQGRNGNFVELSHGFGESYAGEFLDVEAQQLYRVVSNIDIQLEKLLKHPRLGFVAEIKKCIK